MRRILSLSIATALATVGGLTATAAARTRAIPRCTVANLHVRLGAPSGAAGSTFRAINFKNTSGHTCSLAGHPGVSYVAGANGHQVGPPAGWVAMSFRRIVIRPGHSAHAVLQEAEAANYSASRCVPKRVRGLRVYPPGSHSAVYVPWHHTVCSRNVGQSSVRPVVNGAG